MFVDDRRARGGWWVVGVGSGLDSRHDHSIHLLLDTRTSLTRPMTRFISMNPFSGAAHLVFFFFSL
jgi:hypothetical protein